MNSEGILVIGQHAFGGEDSFGEEQRRLVESGQALRIQGALKSHVAFLVVHVVHSCVSPARARGARKYSSVRRSPI